MQASAPVQWWIYFVCPYGRISRVGTAVIHEHNLQQMQGKVVKDGKVWKGFHLTGFYINSGVLQATYWENYSMFCMGWSVHLTMWEKGRCASWYMSLVNL